MRYRIHPDARRDLREAARFYRDHTGSVLAQRLFAEFEHTVGLLLEHPGLGGLTLHGKRRMLIRRFPYAVIYAVADDEIHVLAVAHTSRRPGYWRERE